MDSNYYSNFENIVFPDNLENAAVAHDYPYGRLTTDMFYFVEYRKNFGWRPVNQSLNPKTGKINKPHAGNYSPLPVFVATEKSTGHLKFVFFPYMSAPTDWQAYIDTFWSILPEDYRNCIKAYVAITIMRSPNYYKDVNILFPEVVK